MKALFLSLALAFSFGVAAESVNWSDDCHTGHTDGQCDDAKHFTCYVKDGDRVTYKKNSDGWADTSLVQYRVMKLCRAESRVPRTCKPLGCQAKKF